MGTIDAREAGARGVVVNIVVMRFARLCRAGLGLGARSGGMLAGEKAGPTARVCGSPLRLEWKSLRPAVRACDSHRRLVYKSLLTPGIWSRNGATTVVGSPMRDPWLLSISLRVRQWPGGPTWRRVAP